MRRFISAVAVVLVMLGVMAAPVSAADDGNMLRNASFERADIHPAGPPNAWYVSRPGIVVRGGPVIDGAWAMRHENDTETQPYYVAQRVNGIVPGARYTIKGWFYFSTSGANVSMHVRHRVDWYDAAGTLLQRNIIRHFQASNYAGGWNSTQRRIVAPAGASYARVMVVVTTRNDDPSFSDDLFSMDKFYFGIEPA